MQSWNSGAGAEKLGLNNVGSTATGTTTFRTSPVSGKSWRRRAISELEFGNKTELILIRSRWAPRNPLARIAVVPRFNSPFVKLRANIFRNSALDREIERNINLCNG